MRRFNECLLTNNLDARATWKSGCWLCTAHAACVTSNTIQSKRPLTNRLNSDRGFKCPQTPNRLRLSHRLLRVQEERVRCRSISGSAHGASNSFAPR